MGRRRTGSLGRVASVPVTDPTEPFQPGGEPRGTGASRDAPSADVPAVDEQIDVPVEAVAGAADEVPLVLLVPEAPLEPEAPDPLHPLATLRRAPRYRAFVGTGVVLGVVVALLLTTVFPDDGRFSTASVLGYLAVILALVGGLLGAVVALAVEAAARPRG